MITVRLLHMILFSCTLAFAACSTSKSLSAGKTEGFIPFSDQHIQYEGRVGMTDSTAELYWSGTMATVRFTGTGLSATMQDFNGQNWFNVIVDSQVVKKIKIDAAKKTYVLAENLPTGTHTLTLFKRTQIHKEYKRGYTNLYGFQLAAGAVVMKPLARPKRAIEFYGNSVTCGHAIEDTTGNDSGASLFENNYLAYGALTARHFNARYHCISKSGIGLMVSFGALIMPEMFSRLNPFDSLSVWNFKQYTPDIVVVNLLQNDQAIVHRPEYEHFKKRFGTQPPNAAQVIQAYQQFIQQLRQQYPQAHIICALGSMDITREGHEWPGYVRQAVQHLNDKKVYTHFFPYKGTPKHPLVKDHAAMAQSLINFIDQNIKW
jgi:lysophospholipase L1-like esterase